MCLRGHYHNRIVETHDERYTLYYIGFHIWITLIFGDEKNFTE